MTREELLALVNKKEDTTKFVALSQKTIEEELDDVLDELGDDETANDKIVEKLAKRLKRMDGNVHTSVSAEVKKNREAEEARKRGKKGGTSAQKGGGGGSGGGDDDDDDDVPAWAKKLMEEVESEREARLARDAREQKAATLGAVRAGLKEKFEKGNLELNDFFLDTALSKLEIPEKDADVSGLVAKAESIYTSDYKKANGGSAVPRKGNSGHAGNTGKIDEHEWDDIKAKS